LEPELRPPRIDNPAKRYGVWWHDFAEQIDWQSETKKWSDTFERNVTTSPDVARSKREWQLLRTHIESANGLARILRDAHQVRQEMPFFWKMNHKCLEGIIDLASFNQAANMVFILDWKTNRIAADKIDFLRELYRPQMAAYWQAVLKLTNARVSAAVYSTATGQLVIYGDDELSEEWRRLSGDF
jgi:ATP-dependent exoDNAse (exonuclease V) beta subunit